MRVFVERGDLELVGLFWLWMVVEVGGYVWVEDCVEVDEFYIEVVVNVGKVD